MHAYFVLQIPGALQVSLYPRPLVLQGIAAGIGMSNFLRAFLMMCLNSSSSGSMKKIRRDCLAFFLGHTLIGRNVVWTCDKGSCNHMKEARQQGTTLDKCKKALIRSNAHDLEACC